MFLGDHWIGIGTLYGQILQVCGLDAVFGSVGGVTLRMISDIEGVKYTEAACCPASSRCVLPGGDPIGEARTNWLKARRASAAQPAGP